MNNPARNFGLLSADRAGSLCGVDFLRGIMDGRYPAPPFSEVADVWPVSVEVGRIVFEATPSARFYNPLGIVHGAAMLTGRVHMFLAESITEAERNPESYEQDMEVLRLPFQEAFQAAMSGEIAHSGSVTALSRTARALKLI